MTIVYILLGLIFVFLCVGFLKTYAWLHILAAKSNRYDVEIKEIKGTILALSRICMPGKKICQDLTNKKSRA